MPSTSLGVEANPARRIVHTFPGTQPNPSETIQMAPSRRTQVAMVRIQIRGYIPVSAPNSIHKAWNSSDPHSKTQPVTADRPQAPIIPKILQAPRIPTLIKARASRSNKNLRVYLWTTTTWETATLDIACIHTMVYNRTRIRSVMTMRCLVQRAGQDSLVGFLSQASHNSTQIPKIELLVQMPTIHLKTTIYPGIIIIRITTMVVIEELHPTSRRI